MCFMFLLLKITFRVSSQILAKLEAIIPKYDILLWDGEKYGYVPHNLAIAGLDTNTASVRLGIVDGNAVTDNPEQSYTLTLRDCS